MTEKKLIFITMLVLFILSIGMVSAADDLSGQSDDISIDSSQDELSVESNYLADTVEDANSRHLESENNIDNVGSEIDDSTIDDEANADISVENKTFDAIQKAIAHASENDTVILDGTYISSGKNMIIVNKAITIQGINDAILDGNHFKTRFRIDAPNVVFKDISFKNFKFEDNETAIIITKNGVTINNCNFNNNVGLITAILATGGTSKIINSNFTNNANDFGAIYLENAKMDILNSSFTGNKYLSSNTERDIDSDELSSGLIVAYKYNLSLSNLNFHSNKMNGLSVTAGTYTVDNCVFNNTDSAIDSADSNSTIKNSIFTKLKNGIALYGGKNTINACSFINNTAISLILDGDYYKGSFSIINSKFIDNINKKGPSALYAYQCGAKIINCTFKNNSNLTEKGIIFLETNDLVTVTNKNKTQKFKNATVLDNSLKAYPYITFSLKKSFTTSYKSGKLFIGKVIYGFNKKTMKYFYGLAYIEKGKKQYYVDFDSNIKVDLSKYPVGTYKVRFCVSPDGSEDFVWRNVHAITTLKITKAKTVVSAPKVKYKYKKSKYFKVTVKNKVSKKAVSGLKLRLKVYTGKKYKTYTIKTNKKGLAKFNTKKLKRGKHKVVISSANNNYVVSKTSLIRIK